MNLVDMIWIISEIIIYGFEVTVVGLMAIGIIGISEKGNYKNPKLRKVYDVLFNIEEEA